MNRRFLDFLELAPRSSKPRARGLTTVGEHGYAIGWLREMLEMWGEYIDIIKLTPTSLHAPWNVMEKKVQLYRDHDIGVGTDDPIFAIAYYEGKAEQLLRTLRELGFTHVQIDTQHIKLEEAGNSQKARDDESYYIAMARELGFKVTGEVGLKTPEGDIARAGAGVLNVDAVVEEVKRLLKLGCAHVYLESKVIRDVIGVYGEKDSGTAQIRRVVEAVGQDNIFIEVAGRPFDTRMCQRFWAVRNFGPEVNMSAGGSLEEIRYVEAVRRGNTFVHGPSRTTSRLWLKSVAKNGGKAAPDWWKEEYPMEIAKVQAGSAG